MSRTDLSRRELLLAASSLAVTGLSLPRRAAAAQRDQPELDLIFRTTEPRNGEPEPAKLVNSWITPIKHFYVRSHAPNPKINIQQYRLTVEGHVRKPQTFSIGDLSRFPRHRFTATLTCAGNRRAEFNSEGQVGGVQWEAGAIGNAHWSGIALADVLKMVEVQPDAKHVWFEGLDEIGRDSGVIPFGGSIPLEKAMIRGKVPGALLADQMNNQALNPDHGYPLRTVVPGYIGARSVKWLGRIIISDRPSPNHYLARAYKLVQKTDAIDWTESGPIYRYPINGAIADPVAGAEVPAGRLQVSGYALPTGRSGAAIKGVQISTDDGATWQAARLTGQASEFCWQLWTAEVQVTARTDQLLLRADDTSGGFMPQRAAWNAKGYLQNSWYRLPVRVR